ncbi:hypothetical protein GCM10014713_54800 [Streptomyces purpureus]|uniref:Uncharacterized protein n=1 Tax=Streptomyces purpureus TaxID=1951 RepID=A0A918HCS5_9ACTN|nr:hypothetical protein GCM10014713_54800 [Streptomyces purpureus]
MRTAILANAYDETGTRAGPFGGRVPGATGGNRAKGRTAGAVCGAPMGVDVRRCALLCAPWS